jgi:NAD+-dependent protein deacetylase SIR2
LYLLVPDFRSSKGLFKTLRTQHKLKASGKQLFDASVYKHNDSTESFHHMVREMSEQTRSAQPSPFHHMVASIAEEGRLLRLYTQNIDCIDTAMPPLATSVPLPVKGPWPKTIQLHGGLEKMVCSKCGELYPFDGSLFNGPEPPPCSGCLEIDNVRTSHAGKRSHGVGKLRPRMVLYNELNPDQDAITNVIRADRKQRPDAVIVVGTSMKIPGVRALVKDLCGITRKRKDGVTAWINLDSEPSGADLKDCWDLVVRAKCDDVASLVGLPHWDESPALGQDVKIDDDKFEKVKQNLRATELEVRIPSSPIKKTSSVEDESRGSTPVEAMPKSLEKVRGGIPTPTASPKMRTALPDRPQPKTKQSQLSFTGAKTGSAAKDTKKPVSRKPRQPKKTEMKPKATLKTAFKPTKAAVVATTKKQAKRELEADRPPLKDAKPVNRSDFSLRPSASKQKEERYSIGSSHDQTAVDSQLQQETNFLEGSTTPTQTSRPGSSHSLTITPPSKPRGLATMID